VLRNEGKEPQQLPTIKKTVLLSALITASACYAQYNPVTSGASFLTIAPDAFGAALGEAGAATSADNYSIHYNLAKQSWIQPRTSISLSHTCVPGHDTWI
jgi:hypothetical protein